MILVYKPETGEAQRWDLDNVKATFAEAKAAEAVANFSWVRLGQELGEGNLAVLQAALWILRKREEPTLKFADLEDLPLGAVAVEHSPAEKQFMREHILTDPSLSEPERAATLKMLELEDEPEADAPKAETA
ncbi:hypothetical protein [Streptomyces lycii]|uniref:Uncharacterized protein n=1 Tax=Streptomyces lycii TaxID=2654337 RepID=A0ABQ7FI33_9ACTN|nr:hypothetical protein [Streptomyces lycii]KAF4408654.1 hypothetical protein GCU69_13230 [Streptomyces lycii]